MIKVEHAKKILRNHTRVLEPVLINCIDAHGYTLAESLNAPCSLPPFNQSAMDGYALGQAMHYSKSEKFLIIGEIRAGETSKKRVGNNEAARIFTGAPIPAGTVSVVMQEHVSREENYIVLNENHIKGSNIRPEGEQIKAGDTALDKGSFLNPAAIGFISSLGISKIKVIRKAKVGIIVTGNELIAPGKILKHGQIYESNGTMLMAALKASGFEVSGMQKAEDDLQKTIKAIDSAIKNHDVVLISGGISVGDYDHVKEALDHLKVETLFYKVRQKPGKPFLAGLKGKTLIFALPGNPASALICYYEYVLPCLKKMSALSPHELASQRLPLANDFIKNTEFSQFLKARANNTEVEILSAQSSAMLRSFAQAKGIVYLPEGKKKLLKGEAVEVHILPH